MTFLPGKHDKGSAGSHWRNLGADVARLREDWAVDTFILLVRDEELVVAGVAGIAESMATHGIELVRYPIVDMDVPTDLVSFRRLLDGVGGRLRGGKTMVVACRGGLGRTGTVVGCLLREAGLDGRAAIALTRASRPSTIQGLGQEAFIDDWQPSQVRATTQTLEGR